ncbi:MAG: hypothetical protein ACOCV8_02500 [Spirochaetota bacterium]
MLEEKSKKSSYRVLYTIFTLKSWETIGYDKKRKCIKYRPYDGKIRPKEWTLFENKENHFKDKKSFMKYFQKAIEIRNMDEIITRFKTFTKKQQKALIEELKNILESNIK